MGLFDRVSCLVRSSLKGLVRADDPEKLLEQALQDMQADLIELRRAVAQAIATYKRSERQLVQSQLVADQWQQRAKQLLQQGDEELARESLVCRKFYNETAASIQTQLQQQTSAIVKLKQRMTSLESKIVEAKTRRDLFIARACAAQASRQLHETLGRMNPNKALNIFEQMEARVQQLEAQAEVMAELSGDDLGQRLAGVDSGTADRELAALKTQLLVNQAKLPLRSG